MRPAVGFSPVGVQRTLQIFGCLAQGWKDMGGILFSTRAQKNFIDLLGYLSRKDRGKNAAHALKDAFPQRWVTTHKVQYEQPWQEEMREDNIERKLNRTPTKQKFFLLFF